MAATLRTSIDVSSGALAGGVSLLRMATASMMPSSSSMLDDVEPPASISYPRYTPLDSEPPPGMAAATAALSRPVPAARSKPAVSFTDSAAQAAASSAAADSASTASSSSPSSSHHAYSYSPPKLPRSSLAALAATGVGGTSSDSGGGSSGGSGGIGGPLRVPLLEEEIRLLRRALSETVHQKDSLKSHLFDLEKIVLDLREEKRCAEEQLRDERQRVKEWTERDERERTAAAEKERAWVARMEAKETELARAQKKSFELEDALYAERSALAELRSSAAQALQTEQRFKAECEAQLKKQVRALCIDRNSAVQRASELESDLTQARHLAARIGAEKTQLFDQLYSASRLGPDHQPARECRAPEAALLELQRGEMENLRSRLASDAEESAKRTHALRVELRAALQSQHDLRDKVAELKGALNKCMAAMDEQRNEADEERRVWQNKVDELQRQLQQQRDEAPLPSRDGMLQQSAQSELSQAGQQQQSPMQAQSQSQSQPSPLSPQSPSVSQIQQAAPTSASAAAASAPSSSSSGALSSHDALAQTQLLLQQEQAATELRRQRREERRQALNGEGAERRYAEAPHVAATAAPVAPAHTHAHPPATVSVLAQPSAPTPAQSPQLFSLNGRASAPASNPPSHAPLVIRAEQASPPSVAAAAPTSTAPSTASMPPVTFDWSFMEDERGLAMRPFERIRLQEPQREDETGFGPWGRSGNATVAPAPEQTMSFEEAKEAQMHRALEHALREVEKDQLKRHSVSNMAPSSDHAAASAAMAPYPDRFVPRALYPHSPPRAAAVSAASVRSRRSDHASDEHTLEYALAQLARLKRRSDANDDDDDDNRREEDDRGDVDAERDGESEALSGRSSQMSSARSGARAAASSKPGAASQRRASVTSASSSRSTGARPATAGVSTAVRSVSIKKIAPQAHSSGSSTRTRDSGSNHEVAADRSRAPLYQPNAAVRAAAASALSDDDDDGSHEPSVPSGSSRPDRDGARSDSRAQRMAPLRKHAVSASSGRVPRLNLPAPLSPAQQAKARSVSRSRAAGRSESVERIPPGGALGRVTASLRNTAASIKKHKR